MTKQQILEKFVYSYYKDEDIAVARLMCLGWDKEQAKDIVWAWKIAKVNEKGYPATS